MKEDQQSKWDDFLKKMVTEAGKDEAPANFTQSVMDKVHLEFENGQITTYKPLVTKRAWFLIAIVLVGLCAILLIFGQEMAYGNRLVPYLDEIQLLDRFNIADKMNLDRIGSINIHDSVIYALLTLPVFLYIQIYYLEKNYLKS